MVTTCQRTMIAAALITTAIAAAVAAAHWLNQLAEAIQETR